MSYCSTILSQITALFPRHDFESWQKFIILDKSSAPLTGGANFLP